MSVPNVEAPPEMDANALFTMITGMLGIVGMRSFDKVRGTDGRKGLIQK